MVTGFIAIALIVILVVIIATWPYMEMTPQFSRRGATSTVTKYVGFDERCDDQTIGCVEGLSCVNEVCKIRIGYPCTDVAECTNEAQRCRGVCLRTVSKELGMECEDDVDCDPDLTCSNVRITVPFNKYDRRKVCLVDMGGTCRASDECRQGTSCLYGRCSELAEEGDECDPKNFTVCNSFLVCRDGICVGSPHTERENR